jgi:hypothetical protein
MGRSWQRQEVKLDASPLHRRLTHRAVRSATALGRAAGIEDLEAVALLVQRHVGVTEDDRVGVREPGAQPLQAPPRGAGVVDHTQNYVLELEGDRLGQGAAKFGGIDVAVDGGHWPELTQVGEDGRLAEVAGVDDQVGGAEKVETRLRQKTGTARQMGIGDQCEPDQL